MRFDFIPEYLMEEIKYIPEKPSEVWKSEIIESFERLGLSKDRMIRIYERMLIARFADVKGYEMFFKGEIPGYFHGNVGQEAVAFGVIEALNPEDYVTTNYRGHAHYIARGGTAEKLMAEMLGKVTGCCRGRGGSMYIIDFSKHIMYSSGIVGATIPVAVGISLGIKLKGEKKVVAAFFGDGATNEGEFHESLNLASIWELPVILVIENNRWSITAHVDRMMSSYNPSLRAVGHNVSIYTIDGMDFFEVYKVTKRVVDSIREKQKPVVIEALTHRFHGHTRVDPAYGVYRSKDVTDWYKMSDPLLRLRLFLTRVGWLSENKIEKIEKDAKEEVAKAIESAKAARYPEASEAYADVYFDYPVER